MGMVGLASTCPLERLTRPFSTASPRKPAITFAQRFMVKIMIGVEMMRTTGPSHREVAFGESKEATPPKNIPPTTKPMSMSATERKPLCTCDILLGFDIDYWGIAHPIASAPNSPASRAAFSAASSPRLKALLIEPRSDFAPLDAEESA